MKASFHILFVLVFIGFFDVPDCCAQEMITDRDGNIYRTIEIGDQLWMAGNLNTVHYANGEKIESFCYDHDTAYCRIFGRLYSWETLNVGNGSDSLQGVCPDNWHVPTDEEWGIMLDSLGGAGIAGTVLRTGKYSGFSLKWGGNYQMELDIFSFIDRKAYFWSSTQFSGSAAWMRMTGANMKNVNRSTVPKEYSFSIRCVKD